MDWYARQEFVTLPILGNIAQPFAFLDLGQAGGAGRLRASAGPGLRASWKGFDLMGFAGDALSRPAAGRARCCLTGFSLTYTLTAL